MILIKELETCLLKCWSLDTSSKWSAENPAKGQCGVSSLVVQDILGGSILKTQIAGQWHYYNLIDGKRVDFTKSQFNDKIEYCDVPSNRQEAFSDTNEIQYTDLKMAVFALLKI